MVFKSSDGVSTRKVLLSLDDKTVEVFKRVGEGNASLGARRLAERYDSPAPEKKMKSIARRRVPTEDEYIKAELKRKQIENPSIGLMRSLRAEYRSMYSTDE